MNTSSNHQDTLSHLALEIYIYLYILIQYNSFNLLKMLPYLKIIKYSSLKECKLDIFISVAKFYVK